MNTRFEEKLTEIPEIPKAFGEDGGHFYRYYDAIADEIDDDMVQSLKAQLDGILIYAGLFAGVNSAFLALTLPEMSADPADDTNALLLQLVAGGNGNITSVDDLPSASFSPPPGIFPVNILFCLSLTLALLAAFLAVLGQQWLVYYRKRSGGGAEAQRWEQLRRYLGAKRWRLEATLDDILPSLLQLGLVIFCIAFALYLATLSRWMCYTVAIPMGLALACVLLMAVSAALDQWCPFKSPLSRAFQTIPSSVTKPIWLLTLYCLSWVTTEAKRLKPNICRVTGPMTRWASQASSPLRLRLSTIASSGQGIIGKITKFVTHRKLGRPWRIRWGAPSLPSEPRLLSRNNWVSRVAQSIPRPAESVNRLRAIAAKRVLFTSEDTNALIYTAVNLQALKSLKDIRWLLRDNEFYGRLKQWNNSFDNIWIFADKSSIGKQLELIACRSAFTYLVFSSGRPGFFLDSHLGLAPFPPSLTDSTTSDRLISDLRDVIYNINWPSEDIRPSSNNFEPSTRILCQQLIDLLLLNTRDELAVRFDRWFEDYALLFEDYALLFNESPREDRRTAQLAVHLLAWAIPGYILVQLKEYDRLTSLSQKVDYVQWSLHAMCVVVDEYFEWRRRTGTLSRSCSPGVLTTGSPNPLNVERIIKTLASFNADTRIRPSNGIYVMLLQRAWALLEGPFAVFDLDTMEEARGAPRSFTITAIDLSSYFIRLAWQSTLPQPEVTQLRDNLASCVEVIGSVLQYAYYDGLVREKLVEFLKLVSDGLERRIDIFDESVFIKIFDLEKVLIGIRPEENGQKQLEELQTLYQEIKSAINGRGFINPTLSNVIGNPADPPPPLEEADIADCVTRSSQSD